MNSLLVRPELLNNEQKERISQEIKAWLASPAAKPDQKERLLKNLARALPGVVESEWFRQHQNDLTQE
ncbi:MAG: hypothetical protein HQM06_06250 [Magnetococcales bacterium]|nr:hypothetical protein [Magnetococcales bacterium]